MDDDLTRTLQETLAATSERPVERTASRWLGEAEAVVADARQIEAPEVARERVAEVAELLANVDGTGDGTTDEHVRAARSLAEAIVAGDGAAGDGA